MLGVAKLATVEPKVVHHEDVHGDLHAAVPAE
jgi:hypothetical protein